MSKKATKKNIVPDLRNGINETWNGWDFEVNVGVVESVPAFICSVFYKLESPYTT